jgi:hypothetical protein
MITLANTGRVVTIGTEVWMRSAEDDLGVAFT